MDSAVRRIGFCRNDRKWQKIASYQIYIIVRLWRRIQINPLSSRGMTRDVD
jgi:hypothetical protein